MDLPAGMTSPLGENHCWFVQIAD